MKAKEIKVGGTYSAKVSGKLTTVRVNTIRTRHGFKRDTTVYDVTNLTTGRKTTFSSAMKFRRVAGELKLAADDNPPKPVTAKGIKRNFDIRPRSMADQVLHNRSSSFHCLSTLAWISSAT